MKNILYYILITLISFPTISCKKQPNLHKIKYELDFHQVPNYGYTNFLELGATPCYQGEYNYSQEWPAIDYDIAKSGHWDYEYWELKDGDLVTFSLWAANDYYYDMRIYIDGEEVSYKKMYGTQVIEQSGIDDATSDIQITFTYYE
jgi:hypothetical protein